MIDLILTLSHLTFHSNGCFEAAMKEAPEQSIDEHMIKFKGTGDSRLSAGYGRSRIGTDNRRR